MFERLIDLILDLSKWAAPVVWVQPWEGGVRITSLGRFQRISAVGPGLHFKVPFLQLIELADVAATTINLPPQSLTSHDGRPVTASGIVKYSIKDVRPLFTAVVDREDVLRDVALGAIAEAIELRTWDAIMAQRAEIRREIRGAIAKAVNDYGYKIERFTFSDLGAVRTIRLMQEVPQK